MKVYAQLLAFGLLASCGSTKEPVNPRVTPPVASASYDGADSVNCTGYPEQRVWLESQAWWDSTGLDIPTKVGHHIHVGACWPINPDGTEFLIANDRLKTDMRVLLHGATGQTNYIRVSDYRTVKVIDSLWIGPGNAEAWVPFDLDLSSWSSGRKEFRWTANIPITGDGVRQFNSTSWYACLRSCSGGPRPFPWTESRGWYQGHDYMHARFLSVLPVQPIAGVWTFKVELLERGPGGVFVDPDFHNASEGIRVRRGGVYKGPVSVDTRTLSNGKHRLVLVSSDGKNAGVQVVTFIVDNPHQ
jgi:hypothetical protein